MSNSQILSQPTLADYQAWLPQIEKIACQAGGLISKIYQAYLSGELAGENFAIEKKHDGTPVTLADKQSDALICAELAKLTPQIPVLSEESISEIPFSDYQNWPVFWLVDPLDGTKEFIEKTGEFCVNIALIVDAKPVLGVVYGVADEVVYAAYQGGKAYKAHKPLTSATTRPGCGEAELQIQTIQVNQQIKNPIKVAVSRRHGKRVKKFFADLTQTAGAVEEMHLGSALKSCWVAEGKADVYPRFGPTSLWDTAACQVIVEAAGGRIVDASFKDLSYQPTADMLNPIFMVIGDQGFPWPQFGNVDYL